MKVYGKFKLRGELLRLCIREVFFIVDIAVIGSKICFTTRNLYFKVYSRHSLFDIINNLNINVRRILLIRLNVRI